MNAFILENVLWVNIEQWFPTDLGPYPSMVFLKL